MLRLSLGAVAVKFVEAEEREKNKSRLIVVDTERRCIARIRNVK